MGKCCHVFANFTSLMMLLCRYSQSARQEFLCYQYAAIVKRTYIQLTRSLGSDFDSSISMQVSLIFLFFESMAYTLYLLEHAHRKLDCADSRPIAAPVC